VDHVIRVKVQPMEGIHESVEEAITRTLPIMKDMSQQAALDTFDFLRSYTDQLRPGVVQSGWEPRPAHPGGWADRTFVLMNSYVMQLKALGRRGWELILGIAAPADAYAEHLEGKEGVEGQTYSVLEFATGPGGEWEVALAQAALDFGLEVTTR
jgi:hypothetical protein